MARLSFNQFADLLDKAVDSIPERFLWELSGGFNLRKGSKQDADYYIMGEYVEDYMLGRFIVFYYGSFAELLQDEPLNCWETEIIDTVLHEMQHHLESLAGREDLARQEMEELAGALRAGR